MLKKLFIKNYENIGDVNVRKQYGTVAGLFGIFSNGILFIIKIIIGVISSSVAIIADAFNNLSDMGSSILTILGFKLSNRPADKEHPYGHARYEYITGMIISLLIFAMGLLFAKSSIEKIISPEELTINFVTYIILSIAVIGKLIQMLVYLNFGKTIKSQTILAAASDARNDIISTISVLVAVLIMGIFNINIDGYMGFCVSIFIIISSFGMIRKTIDPLIGVVPTKEEVEEIKSKILSYEGVEGVHDLVVHNYGAGNDFVTAHVEILKDMDMLVAHELIDTIERDIKKELKKEITIHMDPIDKLNPEANILYDRVKGKIKEFDKELEIHDFRMVRGKVHINLIFDVVIPFNKKYNEEILQEILQEEFKEEDIKYHFIINIDKPYY